MHKRAWAVFSSSVRPSLALGRARWIFSPVRAVLGQTGRVEVYAYVLSTHWSVTAGTFRTRAEKDRDLSSEVCDGGSSEGLI